MKTLLFHFPVKCYVQCLSSGDIWTKAVLRHPACTAAMTQRLSSRVIDLRKECDGVDTGISIKVLEADLLEKSLQMRC